MIRASLLALLTACAPGKTECDCADPAAHVHVAPESAAEVIAIDLSGPACAGARATCGQPSTTGCATYVFTARAAGVCKVNVTFASGTFTASVSFAPPNGCCTGYYAEPASGGDIEASRPGGDAGAGDAR